jgi:signal peptidase II
MASDKNKHYVLRILLMAGIFFLGTGLDQATKAWARAELINPSTQQIKPPSEPILGTMVIVFAYNDGAFLGLGGDWPTPFREIFLWVLPALGLLAFGIYLFSKNKMAFHENLIFAAIFTGGVGNVVDRILFGGKVTDFMQFQIPFTGIPFTGVVNFADIYITFGLLAVLILWLVNDRKKKKAQA